MPFNTFKPIFSCRSLGSGRISPDVAKIKACIAGFTSWERTFGWSVMYQAVRACISLVC